jgi:LysM repeat protein
MSSPSIRIVGILVLVSMLLLPVGALAAPRAQGETIHVVQWGETLSLIAERYGVSIPALMAANGLTDSAFLYVGQRLTIPTPGAAGPGGRHVVAAGETLTSIAFRYATSVAALAAANGLSETDFIYVGQVLAVPGAAAGAPAGPTPPGDGCAAQVSVQWGDTLSGIAWQHGTTLNALRQANNLFSDLIYEGQRLCVPPGGVAGPPPYAPGPGQPPSGPAPGGPPAPGPGQPSGPGGPPAPAPTPQFTYYTVRPGDTLLGIAWHFGVSQVDLMRANDISNPNFLYVGQRLVVPTPARGPSGPGPRGPGHKVARLAFARWDGGKYNLYLANTDGSAEQLLLERAAGPSWSPDGQRLSIFGQEGVDRQTRDGANVVFEGISNGVLIVNAISWPGDLNQLSPVQIKREGSARATAWAPNGKMIAWDARPGGNFRIYFWGEPGGDFEAQSAVEIPGEHPDWSPDSSRLVYRSGRDGKQGIWVSNRFDSTAQRITDGGSDAFPRWSPDGQWIAFQREAGGNVDIYVMDANGGQIRRLTDAAGPDALPAWTPDGHIIFRSARGGSWAIYAMNPNGGDQQPIIPSADPGPDWTFGRLDVHALN